MKIIVAGGSGFIGSELIRKLLAQRHKVILLSRTPNKVIQYNTENFQTEKWDGENISNWSSHIENTDAIINLSGENIAARRWSDKQKSILLQSRIKPTRTIVDAIFKASTKPKVLINASAVGYYGNFGAGDVTEDSAKGNGFLAELCSKWEKEALIAEHHGIRVVLLRIGIVLDPQGGALKKMLLPFKLFAGGPLGSGKQWLPWIHRDDVIHIILYAIENESISGPVNLASPNPVSMSEFADNLGKAIGRPSWISVPSFVLKILLGEMSEMLIGGRRIIPDKLMKNGFNFEYPKLDNVLSSMFKKNS